MTPGGEFSFWSCNSYDLAKDLANQLQYTTQGFQATYNLKTDKQVTQEHFWARRPDIVVVGATGTCWPYPGGKKAEIGVIVRDNDEPFKKLGTFSFFVDGKIVDQKAHRLFTDPPASYQIPKSYYDARKDPRFK